MSPPDPLFAELFFPFNELGNNVKLHNVEMQKTGNIKTIELMIQKGYNFEIFYYTKQIFLYLESHITL